jgi:hypothetical protein
LTSTPHVPSETNGNVYNGAILTDLPHGTFLSSIWAACLACLAAALGAHTDGHPLASLILQPP